MATSIPINGLQFSLDNKTYEDIPIAPTTMEVELEQVTANSYRTVGPEVKLYNDFLGVVTKISCTWGEMTMSEYHFLARLFIANKFLYMRFFNPIGDGTFIKSEVKCGNLKYGATLFKNGQPTSFINISQNYTQRSALK